ncbi:MAG: DUF6314 family protein [Loktanella sp.]|nr:DUF6314 family protein [Loktanella sp.]MDO7666723.1 DUF6314 family protein [Loktanella sp.]MDO7685045.1 DUF6314 family protein [Loktanella sp.]MDO7706014.1 DUF6314 family protein [Loktanella sp.]MDO7722715.1 DUF6314 family protein [Loktanella sp.]
MTDAKYGQDGTMTGTATFSPNGAGLLYCEKGILTLATGAQLQAERSYLWDTAGTDIAVRFADGKPFHGFTPDGSAIGTSHLCGADWYNVTYDFTAWPAWSATWIVTGPRKDYTSVTAYNRP